MTADSKDTVTPLVSVWMATAKYHGLGSLSKPKIYFSGSGAGTLGVPLEGTRRVWELLGVA